MKNYRQIKELPGVPVGSMICNVNEDDYFRVSIKELVQYGYIEKSQPQPITGEQISSEQITDPISKEDIQQAVSQLRKSMDDLRDFIHSLKKIF